MPATFSLASNYLLHWALPISSVSTAGHAVLIPLPDEYRRLHYATNMTKATGFLTSLMLGIELIMKKRLSKAWKQTFQHLDVVKTSFHQLVSQAEVYFHSVLSCNDGALITTSAPANCSVGISAVDTSYLKPSEWITRLANARVSTLLVIPKICTGITIGVVHGFPLDVATVIPKEGRSLPHVLVISLIPDRINVALQ